MVAISTLSIGSDAAINFPAVLVANGFGAGLMLVLLLSRHKQSNFASLDGRIFMYMCRMSLILCTLETVGFILDGRQFPGARALIYAVNSLLFVLFAVYVCICVCYVDYKLFGSVERLRKVYPFVSLPALAVCLMSIVNLFTDVFYTVDANNHYVRTPLCAMPFALALCYMTYGVWLAYRYRQCSDRYIFRTVVTYIVPIYVCVVLQLFNYGLALVWASTSFGVLLLYINLQHEIYYIDPLTGLYNIRYMYDYLEHIKVQRRRKPWLRVSGIFFDINSFKMINDTYGHMEGDMVLRKVGHVLSCAVSTRGMAVRYGGDEFVIMMEDATPLTMQQICSNIERGLEDINRREKLPYEISLASGLAELDTDDTEAFLRNMDRRMYEDKQMYRRRANASGDSCDA